MCYLIDDSSFNSVELNLSKNSKVYRWTFLSLDNFNLLGGGAVSYVIYSGV